ncbi:MAG: aggregation-promoting factor C-terminal-like domain-containing protein [Candidatus Saccharimonadales bacterium]
MRRFKFKQFSPKYVFSKRRRLLRIKNHPFIVPVVTLLLLLAATAVGYVLLGSQTIISTGNSHVVIVSYDDKKQTVPTTATTVGDLLTRLHIKLHQGDIVEPIASTPIVEDDYRINVYRAKPVTINDGKHTIFAFSAATTPRSIAAQAGINVYPEDYLNVKIPESFLHTANIGPELIINRATPVIVNLYGTPVGVRTHSITVADLIKEKQIKMAQGDTIDPSPQTKITADMSVVISRKGTKIATVIEAIEPPSQTVEDSTLSFGATAVRQQGVAGKKVVTYQINIVNGKEISRQKIQEVVAEQPVPQIIARGKAVFIPSDKSAIMSAAGISSSDYAYVNFVISHESGWCPTKLQGQVGYCPGYAPAYIPNYLGYGLGQATPGSKMSAFGADWQTNPVTQLRWATSYAVGRYGSWGGAYNFWSSHSYW